MIMLQKFYLVFMGLTYFAIGAWAIIDPGFTDAVGLQVTSDIGYSEIAGIYAVSYTHLTLPTTPYV